MSRYRYLIERGLGDEIGVSTIDSSGDSSGYSSVSDYDGDGNLRSEDEKVEEAKRVAGQDPAAPEGGLRWRDPPKEWQPDAIAASSWLDDGVEENRDS